MKIVHVRSTTTNAVHAALPWDRTVTSTLCGRSISEEWTVHSDHSGVTCGACSRSVTKAS